MLALRLLPNAILRSFIVSKLTLFKVNAFVLGSYPRLQCINALIPKMSLIRQAMPRKTIPFRRKRLYNAEREESKNTEGI